MHSKEEKHRLVKLFLNGLGAVATGVTLVVVLVAKLTAGAWITAILVPAIIAVMYGIKRHYTRVARDTADPTPIRLDDLEQPIVVIPMARWDRISEKAVRFGLLMSHQVKVVTVRSDVYRLRPHLGGDGEQADSRAWPTGAGAGHPAQQLSDHPGRLMDYIIELEDNNPGRKVAVLLPELVVRHWWENFLHNQRVQLLKLLLLLRGNQRIIVVNIPCTYRAGCETTSRAAPRPPRSDRLPQGPRRRRTRFACA